MIMSICLAQFYLLHRFHAECNVYALICLRNLANTLGSENARPVTFKLGLCTAGLAYPVAADPRLSRRHW